MSINVEHGTIMRCDKVIKMFITHLHETRKVPGFESGFIIRDLGDYGLLVKDGASDEIYKAVNAMLDSNQAKPRKD
eukprot:m.184182 g.184182  ORF g.184182 m.184182 type:complete len:76 (-) comp15556_c0_seq18:4334-4561(-)